MLQWERWIWGQFQVAWKEILIEPSIIYAFDLQFNTNETLWSRPLQENAAYEDAKNAEHVSHLASVWDLGLSHQRYDACVQKGGHVEHDADDEDEEWGPCHEGNDRGGGSQMSQGLLAGGDSATDVIHDHVRRELWEGLGTLGPPSKKSHKVRCSVYGAILWINDCRGSRLIL